MSKVTKPPKDCLNPWFVLETILLYFTGAKVSFKYCPECWANTFNPVPTEAPISYKLPCLI